ncbi:hypothetical protein DFH09DRAFT_1474287 [Mycena vulgaris]|nr:hypothetical protein DFH09DRAFT_1474287 [Mycena vulgaris]
MNLTGPIPKALLLSLVDAEFIKARRRSRKATAEPEDAGEEQVKPGIPEVVKDEEAEPVIEALASRQPSASAPMAVEPVVENENENEPGKEPEESAPAMKVRMARSRKVKEEVREPDYSSWSDIPCTHDFVTPKRNCESSSLERSLGESSSLACRVHAGRVWSPASRLGSRIFFITTTTPGPCPLLSRVRPASCVPFMDFDAFSGACPILADVFFDENMNYLQWNDTASRLEEFWMTADPSLAQAGTSCPTESPPVHLWGSDDNGSGSSTYSLTEHEISNSEARTILGWEWQKSATVWLDEGVSSEVCHFPPPIKVSSERMKVSHVERVTGLPSQFSIPSEATAFLIDVPHIPNLDPGITVDALLKDQDVHSWGGSTGSRSKVDAYIPGIFFGCANPEASIATRRPKPECCGSYACESLAPEFTNVERRELDPNSRDRLVKAQLPPRDIQDNTTRTDSCNRFMKSISDWRCAAVDAATNRVCSGGKAVPKKLAQCPAGHRTLEIPDSIDEELLLKAVSGEKVVEDEDQGDECCKVSSWRQGKKGRAFIRSHGRSPALFGGIVTHAVAEKYKECVRKFGATVAKVEKAPSTKEILGGLTPSLYHLGLVSRDTKTKLINDVKSEPGGQAGYENQTVESYLAKQRLLPDEKRYMYVSGREGRTAIFGIKPDIIKHIHKVRNKSTKHWNSTRRGATTMTTFKPVVGTTNVYEINGWMPGINAGDAGRVWIKEHDRRSFQFVWEELLALVKRLTNQKLGFAALHRTGTLLGFNADMEAAPLLGLADVLLPTIDIPSVAEEVMDALDIVKRIVRICYSHLKRGIPDTSYLPREDQGRIHNFMYMETPEDVDEFKLWIRTLHDPNGVLLRWWEHREMHQWLLPTVIECLSNMAPDDWHVIEALGKPSTRRTMCNLGSGWGSSNRSYSTQPSLILSLRKSLTARFRYEILDTRRAAEIETMLQSGNLHNPRNEVSHRYTNRNACQVHATAKAKQARVEEDGLRAAEDAVAAAQAHLKQIRAETNVCLIHPGVFVLLDRGRSSQPNPVRSRRMFFSEQPSSHPYSNRGATSDPPREGSTAPGSVASVAGGDETIAASTLTPENVKGPARKRANSTSLESDAPPKRLKLSPLRGWGVERDGVNISATEYAQKHWSEFQDEYPELLSSILGDDI